MAADPTKPISVYVAHDSQGRLRFVGRTRHLARRAAEHAARGWTTKELAAVAEMETALGLEQMFLDLAPKRAAERRADED